MQRCYYCISKCALYAGYSITGLHCNSLFFKIIDFQNVFMTETKLVLYYFWGLSTIRLRAIPSVLVLWHLKIHLQCTALELFFSYTITSSVYTLWPVWNNKKNVINFFPKYLKWICEEFEESRLQFVIFLHQIRCDTSKMKLIK